MKKLENYGLVELNATEIMNIDGGYGWSPIFTCIYGIPVPIPKLDLDFKTFE
jgi:hypothetical protein